MYWKHCENNVKNCINIDLKCLIDLAFHMDFPRCSIHWHKKKIKNTWSLLFCKKIPLSYFYLQLEFSKYGLKGQPQVPSQILKRKTFSPWAGA